ncbi:MAG: metal ABC transporter permease [Clostridiales bacterium]|nr:metal ABC transporter permease [Clostridiales bacterium]
MIDAILSYRFMQNALYAALLASVVTGIIGTIAIEKKLISMSGGIAHASFGGIGLGYLLGFEPIWGGLVFAVAASGVISRLPKNSRLKADTMVGILWSFGMALGILFITLAPGYMPDMTSYLFGDILSVSSGFLVYILIFTVIVAALFMMLFHPLVLYLFDEEYARARGINVRLMEWVVYLMLPIGIIVLVKVVGIILTIALMTIPVSIAKLYFNSVGKVVGFSMLFSFVFCAAGLTLAYYVNIPSGVCIVIISTVVYLLLMFTRSGIQKRRHRQKIHS